MVEALILIMRVIHIASVSILVGGFLYGARAVAPALRGLPNAEEVGNALARAYRGMILVAIVGLTISGLYNLLTHPGHSKFYHALFGVKILLALHVFSTGILVGRPNNPRRFRMMLGSAISGLVIIALSAYLRRIY